MAETTCPTSDSVPGLVTFVLPVRNGMPYLPLSLESLLRQTYSNIEVIVVDDGSNDGTIEYLRSLADPRVRILQQDGRRGVVAALNRGLAEARGEFIARQDADDLSTPARIEYQVQLLRATPSVDILATCAEFIGENGATMESPWTREVRRLHDPATSPEDIRQLLPLTCCFVHGSVLVRKRVLQQAGGYRPDFEWAEDYDLWLRLLPNHRFAKLPQRLYSYRVHGSQVSASRRLEQIRNSIRAKLDYVRRTQPHMLAPVRTAIQGCNPGAALYREVLQEFGMAEVSALPQNFCQCPEPIGDCDCDLMIVTDFDVLGHFEAKLTSTRPQWHREGNFFLPEMLAKGLRPLRSPRAG